MSLRCPDELAREILRSTLAFVADVYSRPGARASTIAAAVEGRMAAAMTVPLPTPLGPLMTISRAEPVTCRIRRAARGARRPPASFRSR